MKRAFNGRFLLANVHIGGPQCRTCVAVHQLPMQTDVEVECIAHL